MGKALIGGDGRDHAADPRCQAVALIDLPGGVLRRVQHIDDLLIVEGCRVGHAGVEGGAGQGRHTAHGVGARPINSVEIGGQQIVDGAVFCVHAEDIPGMGLQGVEGVAVLGGRGGRVGAGGEGALEHIFQGADGALRRNEDKILALRRQGRLEGRGFILSGGKGHLQELRSAVVDDALTLVAGDAVPDGDSEGPVTHIGALESAGVGLFRILQGDGGDCAAGSGADEEAGGDTSVEHFRNQIFGLPGAENLIDLGTGLQLDYLVHGAPVGLENTGADTVDGAGKRHISGVFIAVVDAGANFGFANGKGSCHSLLDLPLCKVFGQLPRLGLSGSGEAGGFQRRSHDVRGNPECGSCGGDQLLGGILRRCGGGRPRFLLDGFLGHTAPPSYE